MGLCVYDPYQAEGGFYKVQLHTHTRRSIDGKWSIDELKSGYSELGFTFVFITDHDKVLDSAELEAANRRGTSNFPILIGGEEATVVSPIWPLGRHMLRLFTSNPCSGRSLPERIQQTLSEEGVVCISHPTWRGNFGRGTWPSNLLASTQGYELIEIYNYHSDSKRDTEVWDMLLRRRGAAAPLWGVAVDDAHHRGRAGAGWIEAKLPALNECALKKALRSGSFYATTGIAAEFGFDYERCTIVASGIFPGCETGRHISYSVITKHGIAGSGTVSVGDTFEYAVKGDEGYIRLELAEVPSTGSPATGEIRRAWSQPFWIEP